MPTRRHPINRDRRKPVTAEWADRFRRICELSRAYSLCVRSIACLSDKEDEFCTGCAERLALLRPLRLHYSVYPWSNISTDFEAPPDLSPEEADRFWFEALSEALTECKAGAA
jgi:hypothetical protein